VLWALALEALSEAGRRELVVLLGRRASERQATLQAVRRLYDEADVFGKAGDLVSKHRRRAREVADRLGPDGLRRLLHYFVDTIVPQRKTRW